MIPFVARTGVDAGCDRLILRRRADRLPPLRLLLRGAHDDTLGLARTPTKRPERRTILACCAQSLCPATVSVAGREHRRQRFFVNATQAST